MSHSKLASKKFLTTASFQRELIFHPNGDVNSLAEFYDVSLDQKERLFSLQKELKKLESDCNSGMTFEKYNQRFIDLAEKYNHDDLFSLRGMAPLTVVFEARLKDQYKTDKQLASDLKKEQEKQVKSSNSNTGKNKMR